MGHIFFIMGISGSGKGTLISNLQKIGLNNIHIPLSYKTRTIREQEKNGIDAWFISKEEFFAGIQAGEFLEYAFVHGLDYYGTKYKDIFENGIEKGKIVIKELDIIGLEELRKKHPELDEKYTTVFLHIPSDILKERIEKRGAFMSQEELEKRLISATVEEQKAKELCNYIIDATLSEQEVLEKFLNILSNR